MLAQVEPLREPPRVAFRNRSNQHKPDTSSPLSLPPVSQQFSLLVWSTFQPRGFSQGLLGMLQGHFYRGACSSPLRGCLAVRCHR